MWLTLALIAGLLLAGKVWLRQLHSEIARRYLFRLGGEHLWTAQERYPFKMFALFHGLVFAFSFLSWATLAALLPFFWRFHRRLGEAMSALSLLWSITWLLDFNMNAPFVTFAGTELQWAWACVIAAASGVLVLWPEAARMQDVHPRCRRCRYDLTGNVSGVCPECGTPIPEAEPTTPSTPSVP